MRSARPSESHRRSCRMGIRLRDGRRVPDCRGPVRVQVALGRLHCPPALASVGWRTQREIVGPAGISVLPARPLASEATDGRWISCTSGLAPDNGFR